MRTLLVCLLAVTAAMAETETYKLSLAQRSEVAGKQLEPGNYKLEIDGQKACFRMGRTAVEVPVQRGEATEMVKTTQIRYQTGGAMYRITEIQPKGTQVRLKF